MSRASSNISTSAAMIRLDELGEREIEGLRPDMALVGAAASRREIYNYTGRLMRVLGSPAAVLPTHWDIYSVPFDAPQDTALARLADFAREVHAGSPTARDHSEVLRPDRHSADGRI